MGFGGADEFSARAGRGIQLEGEGAHAGERGAVYVL